MNRTLLGLSFGSGLEGADVAVVRATGVGLGLVPRIEQTARFTFPLAVRDALRSDQSRNGSGHSESSTGTSTERNRQVADTAVHATRTALAQASVSTRDVFTVGLLDPGRPAMASEIAWPEVADRIAEQTGLTLLHGFRSRDRAAGGAGHPITTAADYLLLRDDREERLLVHLGSAVGVTLIPPMAKVSAVLSFEAGPGNELLDALNYHGSRGRERTDPGGRKAVQGCCVDPLLTRWLEHPYLTRKPPKAVRPDTFGRAFLHGAFDSARQLGTALPDLLCTVTHLIARSVGEACRSWLPAPTTLRHVLLTGGGVRNGFLCQLLPQQFQGLRVQRAEGVGLGALARNAAAAAVLAALTCDGVAGNLPHLTGATGGRLLGHITPGDGRNWARCAAWIADQTGDYPGITRAA
jgi:anhydro-N-acetylmuramic acid kinase